MKNDIWTRERIIAWGGRVLAQKRNARHEIWKLISGLRVEIMKEDILRNKSQRRTKCKTK